MLHQHLLDQVQGQQLTSIPFFPVKTIKILSYALKRVTSVFYFWNRKTFHKDDYQLQLNEKKYVKTNNLVDVCSDVMLHWVLCNVYTVTRKAMLTNLTETWRSTAGRREKIHILRILKISELNAENCLTSNVMTRNA